MRIKYSKETDILLISLREGKLADSIDLKEGVILHLDDKGLPLEIEILDAAKLSMIDEMRLSRVRTQTGGTDGGDVDVMSGSSLIPWIAEFHQARDPEPGTFNLLP